MEARRRAAQAPDAADKREHAVVTKVVVDDSYKFPQTELSVIADNMGQLIQDID